MSKGMSFAVKAVVVFVIAAFVLLLGFAIVDSQLVNLEGFVGERTSSETFPDLGG
jgi:hypothetical protein